jgi:diguanylate cyclase (GGDEF)-like protein
MVNTVSSQIVTHDGEDKPNTNDRAHAEGSTEHSSSASTAEESPDQFGTDQPDLGELTAVAEQFNAAFNSALYELESSRKLIRERSARIDELNDSISSLRNRLDEESRTSRNKDEEHAREAEQLQQRLQAAESECYRLQQQASDQETALQARIDEAEQLQQRLQAAESECNRLQQQAGEQGAALQARIDEAGQLTQRVEELNRSLEKQVDKGRQAGEEFTREKDALAGNLAELQQRHATTCEELDGFSRKVGELTAEITSLKEASELKDEAHSRETERLGSELQGRENELESLRGTNRELSEHVDNLQGLNRALHESTITESRLYNKTLDDKAGEIETLRKLLDTSGNAAESMPQASEELTQLQAAHHELESRLHEVEEQREALAGRANAANELEAEVARLNSALHEASKPDVDAGQLQAALQEASRLEAEVEQLNTALQEASKTSVDSGQLDSALQNVSRLEAEVSRLNMSLQEASETGAQANDNAEQAQSLKQQIAELEASLETTRAERDALDGKLADHGALEHEVETLKQAIVQSESEKQDQAIQAVDSEALTNEVENLKSALATAEQRCVQLQAALDESAAPAAAESTRATPSLSLEPIEEPTAESPAEFTIESPAEPTEDSPTEPIAESTTESPAEPTEDSASKSEKAIDREQFLLTLNRRLEEKHDGEVQSTVIYVLMDNYIRIRDEIGIMNSEHVMREVFGIIGTHCDGDTVARFGDCTFAVLCNDADIDMTREKAEKVRTSVEGHIFDIAGQSLVTTTSIGVCSVRGSDDDAEKVINRADLACESARTSGGNQVLVSSANINELDISGHNDGHAEIVDNVIKEGRVKIYYQPITSLKGNASHCYEVLTRIVDEEGNIILPGEFFSMAINSGKAMDVDIHVIENIMRMMAGNQDQPMLLFLKLTRQTVANEDFAVWLMEKIKQYNVNPEQLVFEVAENLVQNELKKLSMLSKALNSIGCKMAIEHYRLETQPQHLQHIQADYLKIDSGLVQNINNKGKCFTKVTEIMEVARGNNFITIAEGVESPATLAILWELGVTLAQGYFIQSPVGAMESNVETVEEEHEEANSNRATFTVM